MSIDLIVDGDAVDLNRIPLPANTPIIDDRFKDAHQRRAQPPPPQQDRGVGILMRPPWSTCRRTLSPGAE
jgi:hypothetical protein